MSNSVKYKIIGENEHARIDLSDHLPVGTDVILVYNEDTQKAKRGGYPVVHTCLPHQLYINKLLEYGELDRLGFIAANSIQGLITIGKLKSKRDELMRDLSDHEQQVALIKEELQKY